MIKKCGNCEFWDRNWAAKQANGALSAECLAELPLSLVYRRKTVMREEQGKDCPVYLEKS
jgi:hypothetical protein